MNRGTIYGVGVGPGDPELITRKAARLIEKADALAIPHADKAQCASYRIACAAVPEAKSKPVVSVDMPMTRDAAAREAAYEAGADALAALADAGKTIVFVTLGDPTIYSTCGYLHKRLKARGYDARLVPGVPSFCAAAAAHGTPLCEDREQMHLIPGGDLAAEALLLSGTKVFLKGGTKTLKDALSGKDFTVVAVENCGMEGERHDYGASVLPEDAGYFTLTIVKEKSV